MTKWCVNGYDWCSGPEGEENDGEAWGGKCAECFCWPELTPTFGRQGWSQAYLRSNKS